jgi:hypothetical protein
MLPFSGFLKTAQFRDYEDMRNYYARMINAANDLRISAAPDTNWEGLVSKILPYYERNDMDTVRRILSETRRASNNEIQQDNAINRILGGNDLEWGQIQNASLEESGMLDGIRRDIHRETGELLSAQQINALLKKQGINLDMPFGRTRAGYFNALEKAMRNNKPLKNTVIGKNLMLGDEGAIAEFDITPHIDNLSRNINYDDVVTGTKHTHPRQSRYMQWQIEKILKGERDHIVMDGERSRSISSMPSFGRKDILTLGDSSPARSHASASNYYSAHREQYPQLDMDAILNSAKRYGYGGDAITYAGGERVKKGLTHKIYNPSSGYQSAVQFEQLPGHAAPKIQHVTFVNEPQNRESNAYKEFHNYYGEGVTKPKSNFKEWNQHVKATIPQLKNSSAYLGGLTKLASFYW